MSNQSSQPAESRIPAGWLGKPYYSLDAYCKSTYGEKLYRTALNAGLTCPNRDGTLGHKGCIFCSGGGSGDFAAPFGESTAAADSSGKAVSAAGSGTELPAPLSLSGGDLETDFQSAFEKGKAALARKKTGQKFIIYFQAYTNTYGPLPYLERIYRLALEEPSAAGISIATRPDCLPGPVMELLSGLRKEYPSKFIWTELGLQTIHQSTADFIRRGYPLSCFREGVEKLRRADIPVIAHVILGLPGETRKEMLSTIDYLNRQPVWGIKLQLLHILRGTDLGHLWEENPDCVNPFPSMELYLDALIDSIEHLRPDMVIHRLTGDAPRALLLSPRWSTDKKRILNTLHRRMKEQNTWQGRLWRQESQPQNGKIFDVE